MKVGVIGVGHVGRNVIDRLTTAGVTVVAYDKQYDEYPVDELSTCDFAVICVGTPRSNRGRADVSQVFAAVHEVPCHNVLIRSTVPPGTTSDLIAETGKLICFSPEYVGETRFLNNTWAQWGHDNSFVVLGGEPTARRYFLEILSRIHGPAVQMFQCSAVEAELVKYMENSYFATKVTFANEFFELCGAMGADWHTVREGWLLDPRVERDHTAVYEDNRGFGGRCLPKDLDALLHLADTKSIPTPLLSAVRDANQFYRGRRAY